MVTIQKLKKTFIFLACFVGAVALVRDTGAQGQDFEVFWRSARALFTGVSVYDVARDGAMVFKYPPWVVPFFLPFAVFPLWLAKFLWGFFQVLCVWLSVRWLLREGVRFSVALIVLFGFWGVWAVHALDGQVMLPVLAAALYLGARSGVFSAIFGVCALSTKIFSLVSIFGFRWNRKRMLVFVFAPVIFFALSMPAFFVSRDQSPVGFVKSWFEAAASGGTQFEGGKIRGRENQSFTALVLRRTNIPAENTKADIFVFVILAALFGGLLTIFSHRLSFGEKMACWLALGAAVHPLAWVHSFVLAFPLVALACDRAFKQRTVYPRVLAALGLICVAMVTGKSMGSFGLRCEFLSIKSWGVMVSVAALIFAALKTEQAQSEKAGTRAICRSNDV